MAEYSPSIGTLPNGCPGEVAQDRPPLARRRLVFSDNFEEISLDGNLALENDEDDSEKENRVPSKPKKFRTVAPSPLYPSPVSARVHAAPPTFNPLLVSSSSPVSARVPAASTTPDIIRQMIHQRHEEGFRWEENLPWMLRIGEQEYYFPEIQDVVDLTVFLYDIMKNSNNPVPTPFDGLGHGAAVNTNVSVSFPRNGGIVASPPAIPYFEAGIGVSKFQPIVDPEPSGHRNLAQNDIGYFEVYRS